MELASSEALVCFLLDLRTAPGTKITELNPESLQQVCYACVQWIELISIVVYKYVANFLLYILTGWRRRKSRICPKVANGYKVNNI